MRGLRKFSMLSFFESLSVPVALIVAIIVFSVVKPDTFPTMVNARAILGTQAVTAMVALGTMLPLIVGEFDLSLASLSGWTAMEFAELTGPDHVNLVLTIVIVLATGLVVGAINAFVVLRLRVNAFIATLAMGTILDGLSLWITNGAVVYNGIPQAVTAFGQDLFLGLPLLVWLVVVAGIVIWIVLHEFPLGRKMYATGGNNMAARLAGVRTTRVVSGSFMAAAVISALAGVMSVAYSASASPSTGGSLLLPAFAAVFLGSTTIEIGRYNVVGTLFGVLLVAVGVAGLEQVGLASYIENLFNGAILILAVAASAAVGRLKVRRGAAETTAAESPAQPPGAEQETRQGTTAKGADVV